MSSPLPGVAPGQSILTLAHTLHSSLIGAFAPPLPADSRAPTTHLLHPLSSIAPSTLPPAQAQIRATFAAVRASCGSFSASLLDPSAQLSVGTGGARLPATDKLLTLLKETASSQAVLLSHRQDATRAQGALVARRPPLPVLSPALLAHGAPADRTLAILDHIATALALSTFRDAHTLALGGKCMVVDLDVDPTSGRVLRTKFAYVIRERTVEDELIAHVLAAALADLERVHEVVCEARVEAGLARFRDALGELKRLDELTVDTGIDCFAVAARMASSIQSVLSLERCGAAVSFVSQLRDPVVLTPLRPVVPTRLPSTLQRMASPRSTRRAHTRRSCFTRPRRQCSTPPGRLPCARATSRPLLPTGRVS